METLQAVGVSVSHYTGHPVFTSDNDDSTSKEQVQTADIDIYTANSHYQLLFVLFVDLLKEPFIITSTRRF